MLQRNLILGVFLLMMPVVYFKTRDLELAYYVFSMLLALPLYYFCAENNRRLLAFTAFSFAGFQFFYIAGDFHPEMVLFLLMHAGLLAAFMAYRHEWEKRFEEESLVNKDILREWEVLKHKHQHRLDNLQHLEKQASSLMDLFEIARDFSECLSYASLADALQKKVLPELPFASMDLALFQDAGGNEDGTFHVLSIDENSCRETNRVLSEIERKHIKFVMQEKNVQAGESQWIFPLTIQQERLAYLFVEGAQGSDLAKFEVLAAHLVLQIKKIKLYDTVRSLSIIDDLSKVFVRRHFMTLFMDELRRSQKHGFSLALLMLDIDHFKRYNDELGHLVGDATLRETAAILRSSLRKVDLVGRFGGEEFIMALPETNSAGALDVAERIRSSIARHVFKVYDVSTKVTASIGVAVFPSDYSSEKIAASDLSVLSNDLIGKADQALYRAKEEGRNRVMRYQDL
ncbi:MAG: GGDEF domain-containing protein [Candidatus Omnitrophica bacterium]|nr:GGDEF domain-containing protein [Candidatus Omnitrophota bacterium]